MKRYIKLFWAGLTSILSAIANWITTVLGMTDDSKYGKFIRRVVSSCFAILILIFTGTVLWAIGEDVWRKLDCNWFKTEQIDYFGNEELSHEISFHEGYAQDGYLFNRDNKKVLKNICWIAKPLGEDSLVCYSNGEKRGYFNMYTGEVVIKPQYRHAWIFSDGIASVEDDGWIKFIDHTGKVVIDNHIRYIPEKDNFVFHNGLCVIRNEKGNRFGLMDKKGKTALALEYLSVEPADSFWIVGNGKEKSVLNANLETVLPFIDAEICINNGMIEVTMSDHTIRTYSLQGDIIEDFHISEVTQLYYDTDEIRYYSSKTYDDEGNLSSETENSEATTVSGVAHCRRYQAEYNWYGLMTQDGHVLTPPSYSDITAIGPDLYLCKTDYEHGFIINGKGQRVK